MDIHHPLVASSIVLWNPVHKHAHCPLDQCPLTQNPQVGKAGERTGLDEGRSSPQEKKKYHHKKSKANARIPVFLRGVRGRPCLLLEGVDVHILKSVGQGITWAMCCSEDVLLVDRQGVLSYLELEKAGLLCAIKWTGVVFTSCREPATREPEQPGKVLAPGE